MKAVVMGKKERRKGAMGRGGWRWSGAVVLVAALGGGALMGPGCGIYPYRCEDYSECPPEGAGSACTGQCVPIAPLEFNGPALLWIGKESEAPECPARAPVTMYQGRGDLDASYQCPACTCSGPACVLPSGLTASDSAMCQGPGFTAFDAPVGWSGSCTSPGVVPSAELRSVLVEPVTERPCEPVPEEVAESLRSPWGTFALGCGGEAIDGVCGDPGLTCLPTAEPPPPGFRQCIMYTRDDDPICPASYPDKFVFYGDLEDTRSCTPCECTQTAPSQCVAWLSLYQQPDCSDAVQSTMVGTGVPACYPVQAPSVQLGSMEASWLTNEPGACVPSGGEPVGEAKPIKPRTFCCQPPPG